MYSGKAHHTQENTKTNVFNESKEHSKTQAWYVCRLTPVNELPVMRLPLRKRSEKRQKLNSAFWKNSYKEELKQLKSAVKLLGVKLFLRAISHLHLMQFSCNSNKVGSWTASRHNYCGLSIT